MAANFETLVSLPSRGVIYGNKLGESVRIRNMTTREEKKIFGSVIPDIDGVLSDCIVDKLEGFDIENICLQDRAQLLFQLRILTFGPDYWIQVKCPSCGSQREYKIDLSKAEVLYLDEKYAEPFTIKLPKSEDVLSCRYLRTSDIKEIDRLTKKVSKNSTGQVESEIAYVMNLAMQIQSINEEKLSTLEIYSYLQNLHAYDSRYFQAYIEKIRFGVDQDINIPCQACGEDMDTVIPLNSEFFRPRVDIE